MKAVVVLNAVVVLREVSVVNEVVVALVVERAVSNPEIYAVVVL